MSQRFDVVVIGGGLYGTSTAWHLLAREPGLRIAIVEPDPGYGHAASARSNGGVRVQFSQSENIRMSQYGHAFYATFDDAMAVNGEPAHLDRHAGGYLLIATTPAHVDDLQANAELQHAHGCDVQLLDADGLAALRPDLRTDDVLLAAYSPGDIWIDGYGAVTGFARNVRARGVHWKTGRVVDLLHDAGRIDGVRLDGGATLHADWVVNTTGAWAGPICRMAGFDVPVEPMPMMVYYFETRPPVTGYGVTIDIDRVSFRPEGAGFISINRRRELSGRFVWETDPALFEEQNWPLLAHRVPAFETLKVRSSYCCHYAFNHFDGNVLLGAWPGGPQNFLVATGASGHGLQHAPAAGRALSELILDGTFTTLDLSRFGCARVVDNAPRPERGFVA